MLPFTLRQLEYVVAVAEHRHFRRAAEACGVSQPALSQQIRELEDVLGTPLFERVRPRILVTPAGERFVSGALALLDQARELAASSAPGVVRTAIPRRSHSAVSMCSWPTETVETTTRSGAA